MYKCLDCNMIFNEPKTVVNPLGLEAHLAGTENVCPCCGSDSFSIAHRCSCCDEWYADDELTEGICDACIEEFKDDRRYSPRLCMKFAERLDREPVYINPFIKDVLTTEQIEEILTEELLKAHKISPVDCKPFLDTCDDYIVDYLKEGE